ncbi:MAG: DNA polymerase I [Chloroflexi bacterium]|nr:DNA polymerase I [Chloroflexota bacterium]
MSTSPKLILIDGHSLAYRGFFAMANTPLSIEHLDGSKEFTGAVFAFTNMLFKVWKQEQPDFLAIAFDVGRTFRDDLYEAYKGTREKMPDELHYQITRIQQLVTAFGIPIFTADGFEADDVIGTLARRASGEGMQVMIVTGDRDSFQLINPAVTVMTSGRSFDDVIIYDEARVVERFGVRPDQLIDFKAMLGDSSDNVPGVAGIGEKTAAKLLQDYNTLDNIYAHLDQITAKRAQTSLRDGKDSAYLSKKLVTIKTDVPLDVDWAACKAEVDYSKAMGLLKELRFESLIKRIPSSTQPVTTSLPVSTITELQAPLFPLPEEQSKQKYLASKKVDGVPTLAYVVNSDEAYRVLLADLNAASVIAFDTETTGLDSLQDVLIGMSFSVQEGVGWYLPIRNNDAIAERTKQGQTNLFVATTAQDAENKPVTWSLDPTSAKFEPIAHALQRPNVQLIAHNSKFDLAILQQVGIIIHKPVFDTMLAQFVVDPGSQIGLKALASNILGWQMTEINELIGSGKKQISMADVPIEQIAPYAAADADATLHLANRIKPKLRELGLEKLLNEVELPLVPVLIDMETAGVALDVKYLGQLSVEVTQRLRDLEKQIFDLSGTVFNVNSTQQLSDVLFGKLQLPTQGVPKNAAKSKTGGITFSTAADVLESLQGKHDIIPLLLNYRELAKLKGTYVDAIPLLINPKTGRIHTDFNQTGAITGRLSSTNPNLQNIPIKSEIGRRVRKAFVARPGWRIISADYSQVELRILAHLADDPTLKEAFARGEDIHATTAAAIYDVALADVNAVQRSFAKRINFGIAYGMGAFALSQNTGMTMAQAGDFIKRYFERFPRVQEWLNNTKRLAAEQGYVETVLGRRRYFPEFKTPGVNEQMKRRAEREAINHPVQGSAADIMKIAMINIHRAMAAGTTGGLPIQAKMTLQVHDELVFDCPANEVTIMTALIHREMENAYPLSVKLRADVAVGPNWDEVE